ncbi:MAG: hypothetical protein HY717_17790 [Planctomycetes bacterium]|nr:hypothetical protein [Planctomycetota bacterium]
MAILRSVSFLWILLLAGCGSLVGKVSGGRYVAPDGVFSVPVPRLPLPPAERFYIEDSARTDPRSGVRSGNVSFSDTLGRVRSVAYEEAAEEIIGRLLEPARVQDALSAFLQTIFLPEFQRHFPGTRVLNESRMTLRDGVPALFFVLEIPEGSPLVFRDTEYPEGRRLDSTRAFLVFIHDDTVFTLTWADDDIKAAREGKLAASHRTPSAEEVENWKGALSGLYESMLFR